MKLVIVLLCAFAAVIYISRQTHITDREQVIREHRVVDGMHPDEVRRSLGEPDNATTTINGHEVWGYSGGRYVTFAGGGVIDSGGVSEPRTVPIAQASAAASARTTAPRPAMAARTPQPTPQSPLTSDRLRDQFGWTGGVHSRLDEPRQR